MSRAAPALIVLVLLALMAALMAAPIRQESATIDEPLFLATGYGYWHGYGFSFDPEQPPLAKMISAAPLWFMGVTLSPDAQALLEHRRMIFSSTRTWTGTARRVKELFSQGPDTWYFWPYWEGDILGQEFVYGGANDADKLLSAGRWMQVLLTLMTGAVIFLWLRELAGPEAAVFGVALWVFNPLALAYGHLVLTDMGVTLGVVLAVWTFGRFLKKPTFGRAVLCGLSCGVALLMKFTAIVLAPMFLVLGIVHWITQRNERGAWKRLPVIALAAAVLVLLVYARSWMPAPWISAEQAGKIGVPAWFQLLRPVLVPPAFFKGLALQMAHAASGHIAFLCGEWRQTGWWYYFPVAFFLKTPLPLLALTLAGLVFWVAGLCRFSFEQATPWLAALVYFVLAMTGSINIGVRYLLPMVPLLAVGTASQIARQSRPVRFAGWLCGAWLLVVAVLAHPHYLEYFNECAGGPANGYTRLVDSNLDWGQDAKRLKQFLAENSLTNASLDYFGTPRALGYYAIPCKNVTPDQARAITNGTVIISATRLMRPEWAWLRAQQPPAHRIGYTLFVYQIGDQAGKK
jgi:4-amino-4-deoxy-L-arabinose transferase-like glycosyltransferase